MSLTKIDIDRKINSLRISSKQFATIQNSELISMFEECIQNIPPINYNLLQGSAHSKTASISRQHPQQDIIHKETY